MAFTRDEYLQNQEAQFNPQLLQLKAQKLAAAKKAMTEGISQLNQQRDQQLPTYTEDANATDARTAQNIQKLRDSMAANGMYRSGTTVSDTAMMQNQAASDIAKIGRAKTDFLNGINSKIGQYNQGYLDEEKAANDEYAGNLQALRAKALDQWNQMEMQQRAAAVSRARSSTTKQPSATELKQNAWGDALDWAHNLVTSGYTTPEIVQAIQQNAGEFARAGVDLDKLQQEVYNMYQNNRFMSGGYAAR